MPGPKLAALAFGALWTTTLGLAAQGGPSFWVGFASPGRDQLQAALGLADGGVVVIGETDDFVNFSGHFISRLDRYGRPLWHRLFRYGRGDLQALAGGGDELYVLVAENHDATIVQLASDGTPVAGRRLPGVAFPFRLVWLAPSELALVGEALYRFRMDGVAFTASRIVAAHSDGGLLQLIWDETPSDSFRDAGLAKLGAWPELSPACPRPPFGLAVTPGSFSLVPAELGVLETTGDLEPADLAFEPFPMETGVGCTEKGWEADLGLSGSVERDEVAGVAVLRVSVHNFGPQDATSVFLKGLPALPRGEGLACWREDRWGWRGVFCEIPQLAAGQSLEVSVPIPPGLRLPEVRLEVSAWNPDPHWQNNVLKLQLVRRVLKPKVGNALHSAGNVAGVRF